MVNDLNLVNHRSILKLLTAKNLLQHQKFKCELNTVFTKRLTFCVVYRPSSFLQSKILLQFLEFQEKIIIIAGATMQHFRVSKVHVRYTILECLVVQHAIDTTVVILLTLTLRQANIFHSNRFVEFNNISIDGSL